MATPSALLGSGRRVRSILGAGALSVAMTAALAGTAHAGTTSVACGGPGGGTPGLIAAITASNGSVGADTIDLAAGCTYVLGAEHNPGNGLPVITGPLTIAGHGAAIRRSSATAFRILEVAPGGDLAVDHATIAGGSIALSGPTAFGGGILNSGRLAVTNSTISDNTVSGTGSSAGGGGIANNGTATITDTVLRNNRASATGTQIFAAVGGALINRAGATMTVQGSIVAGNSAMSKGSSDVLFIASAGGIGNTGTLVVDGTQITGNQVVADGTRGQGGGGGVSIGDGTATISGSRIVGNTVTATGDGASAHGGGLENNGRTKIIKTDVKANRAAGPTAQGGGLYNGRRLNVLRSHVIGNAAVATAGPGQGGGIFSDAGSVILTGTDVLANQPDNCVPAIAGC